jgi:hypothetical protein
MLLAATLLVSCGSGPDSPPLVYLVKDGNLVDGFQSSYCWDQGGAALCVDTIEPYFDETTHLPANAPIRFQFDTPLPDKVTISVSKELFGETIQSEGLSPSDFIDWTSSVTPGEYIIDVHTSWKQGEVTYWFSVSLE